MNTILLFILKSILVSGILTTWYWLALRDRKLHNYNRFFILFIFYAAIQVPLLHLSWFSVPRAATSKGSPAAFVLQSISGNSAIETVAAVKSTTTYPAAATVVTAVAATISLVLVFTLLMRVLSVRRLVKKYPGRYNDGIRIIYTDLPSAPFSFLNTLFWKSSIPLDSPSGQLIYKHEQAHIQQKHTWDKIGTQLLTCIFWMNPFYWLLQKELNLVHEFIADAAAIDNNDTTSFATMLLQTHNNGQFLVPQHHFFSSPIKRRLTMLQQENAGRTRLRRLMVVPVAAATLLMFSFSPAKEKVFEARSAGKIVLVLDAGHGGQDAGMQYGSVAEKDIALKIVQRLKKLCPQYNIQPYLTRDADETVSIRERVVMSDKLHPDDFISIHVANNVKHHMNDGNFGIAVCLENPRIEESQELGSAIFRQISAHGGVQKNPISEMGAYVLRHNHAPSVLIEFGDINNKQQMQWINDDAQLDELCHAILAGVVESHK